MPASRVGNHTRFHGSDTAFGPFPTIASQEAGEPRRIIRTANYEDLDQLIEIEQACFPGPTAYSPQNLEHLAFRANSTCLVDAIDDIIIGLIIVLYRKGSRVAGIETLGVHPGFRRVGVGRRLLFAAEDDMKRRGVMRSRLEVAKSNQEAIDFYLRAGYSIMTTLPDYYVYDRYGSRDALRMVKDLRS